MLKPKSRFVLILVMAAAFLLAAGACGSDTQATPDGDAGAQSIQPSRKTSQSTFQKIRPTSHIYNLEEVVTAGFKKSKEYDVAGLDHATAAVYGFYGVDAYKRQEYEIRFYATHADAVQYGIPMADEGSGPDAKLTEDDATWDEGITERRECLGNVRGSHHVGKCMNPKFLAYAVVGNMVILCQGKEIEQSEMTCEELLKILPKA
ncbi:MAG: hypothetical protein EXR57_06610 [Dehalococcoidia bacterium]|nr:hypothetical protein [Dehalococcoidia bacterium]